MATSSGVPALTARAAVLLFENGQTTERISTAVVRLGGHALQLRAEWGELIVVSSEPSADIRSQAIPSGVDMARVVTVENVLDRLARGRLNASEAASRLDAVAGMPSVPLPRFAPMAAAGAAALGVIFGAADLATVAGIAASAGLGGCLRRGLSHVSPNPLLQPFAAAFVAGVIAAVANEAPVSHRLLAVCPCMVLVPGPHVLNGAIDLVHTRIPLGLARLAFASLVVAAICIGLLSGLWIGGAHLDAAGTTPVVPLLLDVGAAGIAVAAYGSFFNMPWAMLPIPVAVGMAAHALRWILLASGGSVPTGAFAACLVVSLVATPVAHWLRVPWGALAFASVVSLMPGVFLFQAASEAALLIAAEPMGSTGLATGLATDLVGNALTASLVVVAMTCGLIMPKLVLDRCFVRWTAQR